MRRFVPVVSLVCWAVLSSTAFGQGPWTSVVNKLGVDIDVRSVSRTLPDGGTAGTLILPDPSTPVPGVLPVPQIQLRGDNLQVNDPAQAYVQIFPGFRPFVHATQSETSAAAFGPNIVVTYNNSSGFHVSKFGTFLVVDQVQLSGFSVSHDGGRTWKSGFMPNAPGGFGTYGDPSIGVDRRGVFYFANLGDDGPHGTIQVNRSTDGGDTWSTAVVVQEDDDSDKEWLAVGPDPRQANRDNVYVTWTSFQPTACELRFGRSSDGGATWLAKTIFVPTGNPNPVFPQNCLQYSNPAVDPVTGTLYIPFLRLSGADQDFIQMLVSDDAGDTFRFAEFHIPGAPDATLLPVTQPGDLTACGGTNIRLTVHGTLNPGPGRFGIPRYVHASRLTLQPAIAARNGNLYLAWNNSSSLILGDPSAKSNILFIGSHDGGKTWSPVKTVNPVVADDIHHVFPALALDQDSNDVHISYYTQHGNRTIDLDMANSHDGGDTFPAGRTVRVTSTSFDLPPTNIRLTDAPSFASTHYDRLIQQCYALGEYQSVVTANGSVYSAWGDMRNLITQPVSPLDPISGQIHSQEDVFFQKVKAQ